MAANDFGIVVGIDRYPLMKGLEGAEFDAQQFYDWLIQPARGAVPPHQVFRALSSQYSAAEPTMENIETRLRELRDAVRQFVKTRGRARRLYMFFSGHGLSWNVRDAALLAANAEYEELLENHIAGPWFAHWFRDTAWFEEIILLMDCCRTEVRDQQRREPWKPAKDKGTAKAEVVLFQGFATLGGADAREMKLPPASGRTRGVFTYLFLDALSHGARDPEGHLTDREIRKHVMARLGSIPGVKQKPDISTVPQGVDDFVFIQDTQLASPRVRLSMPVEVAPVDLLGPDLQLIRSISAADLATGDLDLGHLEPGVYVLAGLSDDTQSGFDVFGTDGELKVNVISLREEPTVTYNP
jgi:hypothetical protein